MAGTIIVWRDDVQSSGYYVDALAELVGIDRIDALRTYVCSGPNYVRAIADDLHAASGCANAGNNDGALYRFGSAERIASLLNSERQ